jgi:DNA-binding transcriptional ArsR family regulator
MKAFSSQPSHHGTTADLTAVYGAIADPTRRELLEMLRTRELSITTLSQRFPMSRVAISKHLRVLEHAGLVQERKVGREHRYRLNSAPLRQAHEWLAHYEQFWSEKLENLKTHIEDSL